MTIRVYSAADELIGSDKFKRKCARFEVVLGHRNALNGRPVLKKMHFGIAGTTDAAVEACAVDLVEQILAISESKIMKFTKIMGHYRQDEELPLVATNTRSFCVVGFSPDPADGLEAVNLSLLIPNFIGTTADANNLVGTGTFGGGTAGIGYVRWADQAETELEAMYCELPRGLKIDNMSKIFNEPWTSANTDDGLSDDTIGPKV